LNNFLLCSIIKKEGDIINNNNDLKTTPTNDMVFQLLFGRNKNKHLTDNFIKSTLNYIKENSNLHNIKVQSEVSLEKFKLNDKSVRLDVIAEYDETIVCIEMQNKSKRNIYNRARCYAAKVLSTYLNRGEDFLKLKPLTMIIILNYIPKKLNTPNILRNIITVDENYDYENINLGIKFIFIFLPRRTKADFF